MVTCSIRREKKCPAGALRTSALGKKFILRHETLATVSTHLHWPRGNSGVTIGPGYDMKKRDKATICNDMMSIGVSRTIAEKISEGSHLSGKDAQNFAEDNVDLVTLTLRQQIALLELMLPFYEAIVRRNITISLTQHEFDALVSFAYNPGGLFTLVSRDINRGDRSSAMRTIRSRTSSGLTESAGLITRRQDEIELFTNARY